ncbi:MAG: head GIN domain-containing protein [Bacteroidales bacterium]
MKHRIIFSAFILITSLSLSSCWKTDYFPCVSPKGASIEEYRHIGTFDAINLRIQANVFVSIGEEHSITVHAAENILELIETKSTGKTLIIDNSSCLRTQNNDVQIYITMPEIKLLRVAGSGNIVVDNFFYGESFAAEVSGSGKIYFSGEFDQINSSVSGSGVIDMTGTSRIQTSQISGSGRIDALEMESLIVDVRISGSGEACVYATEKLDTRISGSGKVYYRGNPSVNLNISGSGNVYHLQ